MRKPVGKKEMDAIEARLSADIYWDKIKDSEGTKRVVDSIKEMVEEAAKEGKYSVEFSWSKLWGEECNLRAVADILRQDGFQLDAQYVGGYIVICVAWGDE